MPSVSPTRAITPRPDLAPYLEHFWSVSWDLPAGQPSLVETLPHPTVHLIFESGKGARVGGVSRGKFSTLLEGKGRIFAAKFRPGGFCPFVSRPVSQFSVLERFVRERVPVPDAAAAHTGAMAEAIARDRTLRTVEDLSRRYGTICRRSNGCFRGTSASIPSG